MVTSGEGCVGNSLLDVLLQRLHNDCVAYLAPDEYPTAAHHDVLVHPCPHHEQQAAVIFIHMLHGTSAACSGCADNLQSIKVCVYIYTHTYIYMQCSH